MNTKRLLRTVIYVAIGLVLSTSELTFRTWQFWVIMLGLMISDMLSFSLGMDRE